MHRHQQRNAADTKLTCTPCLRGCLVLFSTRAHASRHTYTQYSRIGCSVSFPCSRCVFSFFVDYKAGPQRNWGPGARRNLSRALDKAPRSRVLVAYKLTRCILGRQIEKLSRGGAWAERRGNPIALNSVYERLQGISSHGCVNTCLSFSSSSTLEYFPPLSFFLFFLHFFHFSSFFASFVAWYRRMILNCWVNNEIDIVYRGISLMEKIRNVGR